MILYRERPTGSTVHWQRLRGAGPPVRSCRLVDPASIQLDVGVRVDAAGLVQPASCSRRCLDGLRSLEKWASLGYPGFISPTLAPGIMVSC